MFSILSKFISGGVLTVIYFLSDKEKSGYLVNFWIIKLWSYWIRKLIPLQNPRRINLKEPVFVTKDVTANGSFALYIIQVRALVLFDLQVLQL